MNVSKFQTLNELIKSQNTGSVSALAKRLDVSERTIKNMVGTLRNFCNCKIRYDFAKSSYVYMEDGSCDFIFRKNNTDYITNEVTNLLKRVLILFLLSITNAQQLIDTLYFLP